MKLFSLLIVVLLLTIYSHAQVIQPPDDESEGVNPEMTPPPAISSPSGFTNIRVHPSTTVHQTETSIAIDPLNPYNIIIGLNARTDHTGVGCYYKTENNSWQGNDQVIDEATRFDPSVKYDREGKAFYVYCERQGSSNILYVSRSTNNGATWNTRSQIPTSAQAPDKCFLSVDIGINSPHQNNVYVTWTDLSSQRNIRFSRSTNSGQSFSTSKNLSGPSNIVQGSIPAVGPNGVVYVVWSKGDPECTEIDFTKSTDGGQNFVPSNGKKITDVTQIGQSITINGEMRFRLKVTESNPNGIRVNSFPSIAVDNSGGLYNGTVYVVWADKRSGNPDIYLIKSTDQGDTWSSTPVRVNSDNTNSDQWFPFVDVGPDGAVNIIFYDSRIDPTHNLLTETYVARSIDGGETYYNLKVSDTICTPTPVPGTGSGYMGDYIGIASAPGKAYPCWMDNRSGINQVYFAEIDFHVDIIVDQQDESNVSLSGTSISRWENSTTFSPYPVPNNISSFGGTNEILQAYPELVGNPVIKFNKWNVDQNITNHRSFFIDFQTNELIATFKPIATNIVIRNSLLEISEETGGNIGFKDPWLIDFDETLYGMRNRGIDAIWYDNLASPFNPVVSSVYKGVFLDQEPSTDPNQPKPYYSIRVPQTQTIGSYPGTFVKWQSDSAVIVSPNNLETPVIFKKANDTVKAQYKIHLGSTVSTALSSNNQPKIIEGTDAKVTLVYESGGSSFYTVRDSGSTTWKIEGIIEDISSSTKINRSPSVYLNQSDGHGAYIYEQVENTGGSWTHRIKKGLPGQSSTQLTSFTANQDVMASPVASSSLSNDGNFTAFAYKNATALQYGFSHGSNWNYHDVFGSTSNSINPAIVVFYETASHGGAWHDTCHIVIVWEEPGTANDTTKGIKFTHVKYIDEDYLWNTITLASNGSGHINKKPSITRDGNYQICVTWEYADSSTSYIKFVKVNPSTDATSGLYQFDACGITSNNSPVITDYRNIASRQSDLTLIWSSNNGTICSQFTGNQWTPPYLLDADGRLTCISNGIPYPYLTTHSDRVAFLTKANGAFYDLSPSTISTPPVPGVPAQVSPSNNVTNVDTSISISWNCLLGAQNYHLQVSTQNPPAAPYVFDGDISGTSEQISNLSLATTYYWRVKGMNSQGSGSYSSIYSFTTGSPPLAPALANPSNNALSVVNESLLESYCEYRFFSSSS